MHRTCVPIACERIARTDEPTFPLHSTDVLFELSPVQPSAMHTSLSPALQFESCKNYYPQSGLCESYYYVLLPSWFHHRICFFVLVISPKKVGFTTRIDCGINPSSCLMPTVVNQTNSRKISRAESSTNAARKPY